jgi:hypothetical protein
MFHIMWYQDRLIRLWQLPLAETACLPSFPPASDVAFYFLKSSNYYIIIIFSSNHSATSPLFLLQLLNGINSQLNSNLVVTSNRSPRNRGMRMLAPFRILVSLLCHQVHHLIANMRMLWIQVLPIEQIRLLLCRILLLVPNTHHLSSNLLHQQLEVETKVIWLQLLATK